MGSKIWVRAIEHETLPRDLAGDLGLSPVEVKQRLGDLTELAVLRCVDRSGKKVTAVGDPAHMHQLLVTGTARDPEGMLIGRSEWPVLIAGWAPAR